MERLVIITGLAGSGKSLAANCLEDLGFFCVDNLPVELIHPFCELIKRSGDQVSQAALVIDARERQFLSEFPAALEELRDQRLNVEVVFFDCNDDVLKRRFSETRRPHPLAGGHATLEDAIKAERAALEPLRDAAARILDTSRFTSHQLRSFLRNSYGASGSGEVPNVNVTSFGFKYGVPAEVDLVFDVRFLPNPYFVEHLRPLTGRSPEVKAFLDGLDDKHEFVTRLKSFLEYLMPLYGAEGKTYLTVGIGCTGGKHRSVALSEELNEHLEGLGWPSTVSHRDLGKE